MLATVRQLFGGSSILLITGGGRIIGGPRPGAARLTLDEVAGLVRQLPEVEALGPAAGAHRRDGPRRRRDYNRKNPRRVRALRAGLEPQRRPWRALRRRGGSRLGAGRPDRLGGGARPVRHRGPAGGGDQIGSVRFRVVGLLEPFGTDAHGMDRDAEIVVPLTTLQRRVMNVDTISGAKLLVRDPAQVEETAKGAQSPAARAPRPGPPASRTTSR